MSQNDGAVFDVAVSNDGGRFLTADYDGQVVFSTIERSVLTSPAPRIQSEVDEERMVRGLYLSGDGRVAIVAYGASTNVPASEIVRYGWSNAHLVTQMQVMNVEHRICGMAAMSLSGMLALVTHYERRRSVVFVDMINFTRRHVVALPDSINTARIAAADHGDIAVVADDRELRVVHSERTEKDYTLFGYTSSHYKNLCAVGANGDIVVATNRSQGLDAWVLPSGLRFWSIPGASSYATTIAFCASRFLVLAGYHSGDVLLFDLYTDESSRGAKLRPKRYSNYAL